MVYYYTTLPGVIPAPFPGDAKTAGPAIITSPRVLLEHALKDLKIRTERADLEDRRRVFRVEESQLIRMMKDATGYYVPFANTKSYFTATDPVTEDDSYIREWGPL